MFRTFSNIPFGTVKYGETCIRERKLHFITDRQTDMSLIQVKLKVVLMLN
jgi:hypothetical protein